MARSHPRWRVWLRYASACVAAGMVSLGGSFLFYTHRARAAQSAVAPRPAKALVAQRVTTYYDASGRMSSIIASRYVRYTDHSLVVSQQMRYPKQMDLLTQTLDRQSEREIYMDPRTRSVTTLSLSRAKQESMTSGNSQESCLAADMARALPDGVYFGHQTLHLTENLPAGGTEESWFIPELDCFNVKVVTRAGGASRASTETLVESLVEGEPDRSLAAVPSGYTERSPTAVDDLLRKAGNQPAFGYGWASRMEKQYQRRKVQ